MTPEEQLARLRSPARWHALEATLPDSASDPRRARAGGRGPRRTWTALVTVVVLVLLVVGTASVLQVARGGAPARTAPAVSPSPGPSRSAGTVAALPALSGTVLHTWLSTDASLPSGPFAPKGRAIALVASCTGGGSVSWHVSGHGDETLGCEGTVTSGPSTWAKGGRLIAEHDAVTVRVTTTGHPRFALRLLAVPVAAVPADPAPSTVTRTGPGVPASLRSCRSGDIAATATFRRYRHFEGGVVTVRSTADTDCAIRTWPSLRYDDEAGAAIGKEAERVSSEGDAAAAPPIRLLAHGTGYVEVELFALSRLRDCGAQQVHSMRLRLGDAAVRIPVPATPATGHCTDGHTFADGVGRAYSVAPPLP